MTEHGTVTNSLTASQSDEDRVRMITNPYWRSPESWVGMPWETASDIWSFGAIVSPLLHLLLGFSKRLYLLLGGSEAFAIQAATGVKSAERQVS
jgi:serine/threonine protein kinase